METPVLKQETVTELYKTLNFEDVESMEDSLFDMFQATLESQSSLGKLTDECISRYLHHTRNSVKVLRLLAADLQEA